jgi:hypothetical protein
LAKFKVDQPALKILDIEAKTENHKKENLTEYYEGFMVEKFDLYSKNVEFKVHKFFEK